MALLPATPTGAVAAKELRTWWRGAGSGLVLLQSVFLAYPLPDPRRICRPFSSGGKPGCTRSLMIVALTLLLAVGAVPPVVLLLVGAIAEQPVLSWLAVPVGVATGALLALWWGSIALRRLTERGPEILATVSKER